MALLSCLLLYNNTAYDMLCSFSQCILHIVFLITLCDALPDTFPGFSSACVAALLRLPLVCLIYPSICSLFSVLFRRVAGGRGPEGVHGLQLRDRPGRAGVVCGPPDPP